MKRNHKKYPDDLLISKLPTAASTILLDTAFFKEWASNIAKDKSKHQSLVKYLRIAYKQRHAIRAALDEYLLGPSYLINKRFCMFLL